VSGSYTHTNSTCTNELLGTLTNNCGETANCRVTTNIGNKSGGNISAGQTQHGELAGYWWCDGSTSFSYQCIRASDPVTCLN
jgi:hypothetical protein